MNKKLKTHVDKMLNELHVVVLHEDNYTLCLAFDPKKKGSPEDALKTFGIAKRNPNLDNPNDEIGSNIVLARSAKKLMPKKRKARK